MVEAKIQGEQFESCNYCNIGYECGWINKNYLSFQEMTC
jgi:hypothetical protein